MGGAGIASAGTPALDANAHPGDPVRRSRRAGRSGRRPGNGELSQRSVAGVLERPRGADGLLLGRVRRAPSVFPCRPRWRAASSAPGFTGSIANSGTYSPQLAFSANGGQNGTGDPVGDHSGRAGQGALPVRASSRRGWARRFGNGRCRAIRGSPRPSSRAGWCSSRAPRRTQGRLGPWGRARLRAQRRHARRVEARARRRSRPSPRSGHAVRHVLLGARRLRPERLPRTGRPGGADVLVLRRGRQLRRPLRRVRERAGDSRWKADHARPTGAEHEQLSPRRREPVAAPLGERRKHAVGRVGRV